MIKDNFKEFERRCGLSFICLAFLMLINLKAIHDLHKKIDKFSPEIQTLPYYGTPNLPKEILKKCVLNGIPILIPRDPDI